MDFISSSIFSALVSSPQYILLSAAIASVVHVVFSFHLAEKEQRTYERHQEREET
jgi:hypothetical protein